MRDGFFATAGTDYKPDGMRYPPYAVTVGKRVVKDV